MRSPGTTGGTAREIPLPAGVTVLLAPGAYRFALAKLSRPLKLGDRVPFVLIVEAPDGSRQEISVNAEVRRRSPTDDHKIRTGIPESATQCGLPVDPRCGSHNTPDRAGDRRGCAPTARRSTIRESRGMQRKLTVIVSADVVGYSGLMERDEAGTLERLKANRKAIFDPARRARTAAASSS